MIMSADNTCLMSMIASTRGRRAVHGRSSKMHQGLMLFRLYMRIGLTDTSGKHVRSAGTGASGHGNFALAAEQRWTGRERSEQILHGIQKGGRRRAVKEFFVYISGCIAVQGTALLLVIVLRKMGIPVSNDAAWIAGCITASKLATVKKVIVNDKNNFT